MGIHIGRVSAVKKCKVKALRALRSQDEAVQVDEAAVWAGGTQKAVLETCLSRPKLVERE